MNQSRIESFLQFQLPAIAWALFIFTVSSIPQTKLPSFIGYTDKLVHAAIFFILCWLFHVAFHFQRNSFMRRYGLWAALLLASSFGISDEYHQYFTPGRSTDVIDWIADTTGASLYVVIYSRFQFYRWFKGKSAEE